MADSDRIVLWRDAATASNRLLGLRKVAKHVTDFLGKVQAQGFGLDPSLELLSRPLRLKAQLHDQARAMVLQVPRPLQAETSARLTAWVCGLEVPRVPAWATADMLVFTGSTCAVAQGARALIEEMCTHYISNAAQRQIYDAAEDLMQHLDWFNGLVKYHKVNAIGFHPNLPERSIIRCTQGGGWAVDGHIISGVEPRVGQAIVSIYTGQYSPSTAGGKGIQLPAFIVED